jgi:predicted enzyme related to lactoylglutathione lyase
MIGVRDLMVVLYVHEMDRAVAFWRDGVGLPVMAQSLGWSRMGWPHGSIGLHAIYKGVTERPVPHAGPNFEVDDLEAAIEQAVRHGAQLVALREAEPRVPVRPGVLLDPDGKGFELRQTVG